MGVQFRLRNNELLDVKLNGFSSGREITDNRIFCCVGFAGVLNLSKIWEAKRDSS